MQAIRSATLLKRHSDTWVSLWNFANFWEHLFFTEHLRWLLERACEGTSLVKILQSCHFNIFGINHRCFRKMPIKKKNEYPRLLKRLSFLLFQIIIKAIIKTWKNHVHLWNFILDYTWFIKIIFPWVSFINLLPKI